MTTKKSIADLINDEVITTAIARLNTLHVQYPAFNDHLEAIERCRSLTILTGRPHCVAILGEAGVGKSHLAEQLKMRHPPKEMDGRRTVPVLVVEVPKHATIKGLLAEMLVALGYQESVSTNRTALLRSLLRLLDELRVDTIVIDEGQHMHNQHAKDGDVADWLKSLINRSKRTIVLMGTPQTERLLAASDYQQTATRFQRIRYIHPFKWRGDDPGKAFRKFLQQVEGVLPFPEPSHLADPEMALRLFCATRGYLRMLFRIIHAACLDGLIAGVTKLDRELLNAAMCREVSDRIPLIANPFGASADQVLEAVMGPWAPVNEPPQSKRRGKSPKKVGPADMLVK